MLVLMVRYVCMAKVRSQFLVLIIGPTFVWYTELACPYADWDLMMLTYMYA